MADLPWTILPRVVDDRLLQPRQGCATRLVWAHESNDTVLHALWHLKSRADGHSLLVQLHEGLDHACRDCATPQLLNQESRALHCPIRMPLHGGVHEVLQQAALRILMFRVRNGDVRKAARQRLPIPASKMAAMSPWPMSTIHMPPTRWSIRLNQVCAESSRRFPLRSRVPRSARQLFAHSDSPTQPPSLCSKKHRWGSSRP